MKDGLCPDMPLLVNDWLSSTAITTMTPSEEGAYIRLLCHAWNEPDCALPNDDVLLAKLSRLGRLWRKGSGAKIRACFVSHPQHKNKLVNLKQCTLRREQEARLKAAQEHGRHAAKARWAKRDQQGDPMPQQCAGSALASVEHMPGDASSPVSRHSSLIGHTQHIPAPTLELVLAEATKIGLSELEAERFFHYWEARDWCDKNGKLLKKWQSVLRTWTTKGGRGGSARAKSGGHTDADHATAWKGKTQQISSATCANKGGSVETR